MNRREFMQCASILVSGMSLSQLGFTLSRDQMVYLATAPDYNAGEVDYFTDLQRQVVAAITEAIIPRTDTPGAIDAGVPRYIELMVADWLDDTERAEFGRGLEALISSAEATYDASFEALNPSQQVKLLEQMEAEVSDHPWYQLGSAALRDFMEDTPFICQIKELTIWGFFTSELGCTQVLRYNPMPMGFDPDVPLDKHTSAWAGTVL